MKDRLRLPNIAVARGRAKTVTGREWGWNAPRRVKWNGGLQREPNGEQGKWESSGETGGTKNVLRAAKHEIRQKL